MISLGIDTSTEWLCLALHDSAGDRIIAASQLRAGRRHAELLVAELKRLLRQAGVELAGVGAIGAGTGPGSYTGLRVGLASAQGLAAGLGLTLAGGDSLQAAAWSRLAQGESGWLTMDARRGNVYAGLYRRTGTELLRLEAPRKLPLVELEALAARDGVQVLEAGAPSAAWLARVAPLGGPAEASYL